VNDLNSQKTLSQLLKEPVSALSHGLGVLLSVAALITLIVISRGNPREMAAFALYGSTLVILYTASTLYHSLKVGPKACYALMRFDHCSIFLLIAGTYTPVCLIGLRGVWGWNIFCIEWILATIGILTTIFWKTAPDWLRISLYVLMGWVVVIAFPALRAALSTYGIDWLIAGGLFYSLGTIVFATDRPHLWPGKFSAHDLWHFFVLGGSLCHFVLITTCIARIPA
jgi:hemolysin III